MTDTAQQTPIADQVASMHTGMAGQLPAAVLSAFAAEQAGLDASGAPAGVLPVGSPMPDGSLQTATGEPTTLAAALGGRRSVVVFYRGEWCPYCNLTLRTYQQELLPELERRGYGLIAISPQKSDDSLSIQEKNGLEFTVLSDPGNQIANQLGILSAPTAATRGAQLELGLDIASTNADGTTAIPMPTTVIVDSTGNIEWIDVHPNYTTRSEPAGILAAIS